MRTFYRNRRDSLKAAGLGLVVLALLGSALAAGESARKDGKKMKPKLFDVRANDVSNKGVPVIKPWKRIVLDPDYAGAWIVAGDVDGDGRVEIVSARNVNERDIHYTCSVVAHRLDGTVLWRWGNPKIGRNALHHDVACQICDWDGDGANEVVLAAKDAIVELDGATGKEKRRFAIPKNASDCIVFANLSGGKRASDILVKTRYGQIWAFNRDGKQLWTIKNPAGFRTAHQPRPIDIDRDGKDEIMAGYAMLKADGTIRWGLKDKESGLALGRGHLDCARLFRQGKKPEDARIVITLCGGNGVAMLDGNGKLLWSRTGHHFESIDVARVCAGIPGKQIIVDIDHRPWGKSPTWVLGENGRWLGQIVADRSRRHLTIDWDGSGVESIVISQTSAMFDGSGRKIGIFDLPWGAKKITIQSYKGDMTGDGIPDLLFHTVPAKEVYLFKNANGRKIPGAQLGTGKNFTLY